MNLIICTTPFQMVFAEKIIALHPNKKFHLFVITPHDNDKYKFYYNRLSKCCEKSHYIKLHFFIKSKVFTLLEFIFLRLYSFLLPTYESIFLANLENAWIQVFLSRFINVSNIYTYDDGTANIAYSSYLYKKDEPYDFFRRLIFKFIGKKFSLEVFKEKSIEHFTIYKSARNIIERVKYIDLYTCCKLDVYDMGKEIKEVRLFLGQPIYEFNQELYNLIPKYIKKYNIENYFYHPRENVESLKSFGVNILSTELIFEDYIIQEMNRYNCRFKIYTLYSGSILNVANMPNIEVYVIKPSMIPDDIKLIYDVFSNSGIKIIDAD